MDMHIQCEMDNDCQASVTMIDNKGYVYCQEHGLQRRGWRPCRKLRPHELNRIKRGLTVDHY